MATQGTMPGVFIGHGSPMNALERNRYTETWRAFGAAVPRPRAILMVSAHWYVNATAVTAMARPKTIHDFFGFPQPLFEVDYPAPGLPALAEEVADAVHPDYVGADHDSWGLDHGAWSVLVHAFPDADVPVVQLSINALKSAEYHVALGAKLAALRERGVLVMASGNEVHNLRLIDWKQPDAGFDWARGFAERTREVMTQRPGDAAAIARGAAFLQAHPTPEHFLPLLYLAGFAAATGQKADVLVDGYAYGSLSMAAYAVGADCPERLSDLPGSAPLGSDAPPEHTNL